MIIDPLEFIGKSVDKVSELGKEIIWKFSSLAIVTDKERRFMHCPEVIIYLKVYIIKPDSHMATIVYSLTTSNGLRIGCNLYIPNVINDLSYQSFLDTLISLNIKYTIVNE